MTYGPLIPSDRQISFVGCITQRYDAGKCFILDETVFSLKIDLQGTAIGKSVCDYI